MRRCESIVLIYSLSCPDGGTVCKIVHWTREPLRGHPHHICCYQFDLPYQFCIDGEAGLKTYQLVIAPFFLLIGFTAVLAQVPASDASITTNPAYQKNCAKCHGKTAEGRTLAGPSLISKKAAATGGEDLRNIIANGKGRMPKFASKLTPQEIDALVRQVQALNGK
jgi:cytochrome c5